VQGNDLTLTIVYDNNPYDTRLETRWGFSCYVNGPEKTILFDVGGEGSVLLSNMEKLDIDPQTVNAVVLSHIHHDHIGGLSHFLRKNHRVTVFMPQSLPQSVKDTVRQAGAKSVGVHKPMEICKNVYSTGELGTFIREESLIIKTSKGLIVITGCAHPGIVEIVERAREVAQGPVRFLVGGQHLKGLPEQKLQSLMSSLRRLGVDKMAPSHCTGDKARRLAEEMLGDRYVAAGVGARLVLDTEPEEVQ